jgi:ammonia channel protein AmtB
MIVKTVLGLRPTIENEESGLDEIDHGESGYHYDEAAG